MLWPMVERVRLHRRELPGAFPAEDSEARWRVMSADPVNSSDEAVEALTRLIADHPMWIADNGRALKYSPEREARISEFLDEAESIFVSFAAAVRAEAVADERRRTLEWALAKAEDEVAVGDQSWFQPEHGESATECTVRFIKALLAAGSVPVATPPAEPAERVTRESIQRVADAILTEPFRAAPIDLLASLQANLPPAPSQPVTCEHGKTRQHYDFLTGCRCAGPVSVPKESSE